MPTILNPRDTERHNRLEDNGSGRRPPVDKHTGGGGNGDNDRNWDPNRQPRSRLMRYRMSVFSMLAGDFLFFAVLVVTFLDVRTHVSLVDGQRIHTWLAIPLPHILWLNTAILVLSSITMELARRSMFREIDVMEEWLGLGQPSTRRTLPWLAATTLLGLGFLAGQWDAWRTLSHQPAFLQANQSTRFFYLITGIHAAHLLLGIVALVGAIIALRTVRHMETRQIVVDCVSWYWHTMGLFWLFLYAVLLLFK